MKFVKNQLVTLALAALIISPAIAAEGLTKGTKSYQQRSTNEQQQQVSNQAEPQTAEEAANMAPAAGDTQDANPSEGKTLREEMRLPRKN